MLRNSATLKALTPETSMPLGHSTTRVLLREKSSSLDTLHLHIPLFSSVFHVGQTLKYRMNLARSEIKNPLPPLRSGSSFAAKRQEAETCDTIMFIHIQALFNLCTPPKSNMIMGKQFVDDVSPVQNGDVPRPSFPARSFR